MWGNISLALTNLTAIAPIYRSFARRRYVLSTVLSLSMLSSMAYHLIENRKHNLPGAFHGTLRLLYNNYETVLNLDRAFAFLSIVLLRSQGSQCRWRYWRSDVCLSTK